MPQLRIALDSFPFQVKDRRTPYNRGATGRGRQGPVSSGSAGPAKTRSLTKGQAGTAASGTEQMSPEGQEETSAL